MKNKTKVMCLMAAYAIVVIAALLPRNGETSGAKTMAAPPPASASPALPRPAVREPPPAAAATDASRDRVVQLAPAKPVPEAQPSPDDEWVVDWDPTEGREPAVVWQKEEAGWTVTLDEAGVVMTTRDIGPDGDLRPEDVGRLEVPQRLQRMAAEEMHARLPMIRRAEWEQEQQALQAQALAKSDVRPVDPVAQGYRDLDAMRADYRARLKVPDGEAIDFLMRKNADGVFELRVVRSVTSDGDG